MSTKEYKKKRNFSKTAEPRGGTAGKRKTASKKKKDQRIFVIQEHWASRHHFDLRLELNGTLKSWAVPKGPSKDPADRRLAVQVEDHPLDYAGFEGNIPKGQYGAGKVKIWDKGSWAPEEKESPRAMLKKGHLKFKLSGKKLKGSWSLIRLKDNKNWLLIKGKDR